MMKNLLVDVVRRRFARFGESAPTILVVGDLMLDCYLWGDVERISPEAPVPVVRLNRETERLGGAGNVAANLAGLGVEALLAGFLGDDSEGERMIALLASAGIRDAGLTRSYSRSTISKTRVIGGHQQMLRLDREESSPYPESSLNSLLVAVLNVIQTRPLGALILSDYAKGVLTSDFCCKVIQAARAKNIPVLVDPKGKDYSKYRGATTLTPNKKEAIEACGIVAHDTESLLINAASLARDLELDFMTVTRGEEGISIIHSEWVEHLPAMAQQVFDVSGAGDTVIATMAAALSSGLEPKEACALANLAAGVVVGKLGTVPITSEELLHIIEARGALEQSEKIVDRITLQQRVALWRAQGRRVVFTNGCFDLLHAGHVTYLEKARKLGDCLVLGLNTDRSVRALKGANRPVIKEEDRARVLAALESVNAVCLFDENDPLELIHALRPDILVKGSDYSEGEVVGGKDVKSWGGRIVLVDLVPGFSTSNIVDKLSV